MKRKLSSVHRPATRHASRRIRDFEPRAAMSATREARLPWALRISPGIGGRFGTPGIRQRRRA